MQHRMPTTLRKSNSATAVLMMIALLAFQIVADYLGDLEVLE
jgi:hypothetical protein